MMYIRTDMNNIIATGHLMRCLSIADAIRDLGENVTFITADDDPRDLLKSRGYEQIVLDSKWNDLESELPVFLDVIDRHNIESILVDHYSVTKKYLSTLQEKVRVAYIDDLNAFIYPVDTLVCYAGYYDKFDYNNRYTEALKKGEIIRKTTLLLGPQFAPLRKCFQGCGRKSINKSINSLLIMSGGSDQYGVVKKLLYSLEIKKYDNIVAICGTYNSDYEELSAWANDYHQIHIYKSVSNIEEYMMTADVAISAAGSTLYELCATGTPTISYTIADNQIDNARWFDENGIIPYAGDVRRCDIYKKIKHILDNYTTMSDNLNCLSNKMAEYVDGLGANRIAEKIVTIHKL